MNSIDVTMTEGSGYGRDLLSKYTSFALTTDLSVLSPISFYRAQWK